MSVKASCFPFTPPLASSSAEAKEEEAAMRTLKDERGNDRIS